MTGFDPEREHAAAPSASDPAGDAPAAPEVDPVPEPTDEPGPPPGPEVSVPPESATVSETVATSIGEPAEDAPAAHDAIPNPDPAIEPDLPADAETPGEPPGSEASASPPVGATPGLASEEIEDPADQSVLIFTIGLSADDLSGRMKELRDKADTLIDAFRTILRGGGLVGSRYDDARDSVDSKAVRLDSSSDRVWFIGDIHGDFLAFEAALEHIEAEGGGPIVFLGDLFDDGPHGYEVLLRFVEMLAEDRGRFAFLPGNHDLALREAGPGFGSTVEPCEFADWLNGQEDGSAARELARHAIEFFRRCPRALFFDDGLLAAHGGFPHVDLHGELSEPSVLNDPRCLDDFVWLRAHERVRHRDPNRDSRGCQFGHRDFEEFRAVSGRIGWQVEHMIRGHDHIGERFLIYRSYGDRLLTINTLSHRLEREYSPDLPYARRPCVALGRAGRLPQVHRLALADDLVREIYPDPSEAGR